MTPPCARRASGQMLIVLLGLLSTLGPFSNDTLLPNFPAIQNHFGVSAVEMQQALTVYFVPFAVMMLMHGTLSDAFGRRRIIMTGMSAYAVAAFVCATAQTFEALLVGRFLQGLSAGAGIVVGRAVIRDRYVDPEAQRALALLMIIFGIAPGIAPIIGGWVGHWFGWRAVFLFLTCVSATLCLVTLTWLPETLPRERRIPFRCAAILRGFGAACRSARFVLLISAFGTSFAGFFIYIVSAPAFGYDILQLEQTEFVWIFGPAILGMMAGSFVNGRLAGRLPPMNTVMIAYLLMGCAALFNVLYHAHHPASLPMSIVPIFVYTVGLGVSMPSITVLALDLMPDRRGLASSLIGFAQSGFSAVLAGVVSHQVYQSAFSLAVCSLVMVALGFSCWLGYLVRLAWRLKEAQA